MLFEIGNFNITLPIWITIISSMIFAFLLTATVIPSIVEISRKKRLFDKPDSRKSHIHEIPTLGGAAVFIGLIMPTTLFGGVTFGHDLKFIIVGLVLMLYLGIKDDLLEVRASKKLLVEIFAIAIVAILGDIRITSFHTFLGIGELSYTISILFTIFTFIVIINGFNLIDGIDGLSAGVGILSTSTLGTWFLMIGDSAFAAFSFSTAGALLALFLYNVFGKKNKIFLGDTGSLILGMVVTIFTVKFLEGSLTETIAEIYESAPSIAIGILIIPMMDTLRVFTLRILVGKSPFKPDRFHTHHKFLILGYNHLKTTLIMLAFNLGVILLSGSLRHLGNIKVLAIIIPASLALTSIPGLIFRFRVRRFLIRLNILGGLSWILPITFTNLLISHVPGIKYSNSQYLDEAEGTSVEKKDLDRILFNAYLKFKKDKDAFREFVASKASKDA
jgi:UDP-N-acetylmuramyl pentapeptide phosphotransferase/UDP-N-acetylglucosamine-1-phosphate transferase